MLLLSRLRLALARRPWLYWVSVALCASLVWLTLSAKHADLDHQRRQWGETRRVWVAAADIAPGELVNSVARDYPAAMVPASAIGDEPKEAIAATRIAAGEVLVDSDLDAAAQRSLPSNWVVFALPRDHTPALETGVAVAVFGSGQRWCDGIVVAVGDNDLDVGVPPECADSVSVQVASGATVLAVVTQAASI